MITPNMDRLVQRGTLFRRAYAQQQVCSPSRNSYMTGRRPDRTQTWNFLTDFRVKRNDSTGEAGVPGNGASWATLPGYVRTHLLPRCAVRQCCA
jgi:arylsulfatase A-like enzyme